MTYINDISQWFCVNCLLDAEKCQCRPITMVAEDGSTASGGFALYRDPLSVVLLSAPGQTERETVRITHFKSFGLPIAYEAG
jgi:glycine cleavage system pyridoxal-binding protein P